MTSARVSHRNSHQFANFNVANSSLLPHIVWDFIICFDSIVCSFFNLFAHAFSSRVLCGAGWSRCDELV